MNHSLIQQWFFYNRATVPELVWLAISLYGVMRLSRTARARRAELRYLIDNGRNGARRREARRNWRNAAGRLVILSINSVLGVLAALTAPSPDTPYNPLSSLFALMLITTNAILVGLDVLDRRDYWQTVRYLAARQRAATALPSVAISIDRESRIVSINDAAAALFGWQPHDLLGQSLTLLMPERERQRHLDGLARYLSTGQSRIIGQPVAVTGLRRDGTEIPLTLTITALPDDDAAPFTAVLHARPAEDQP